MISSKEKRLSKAYDGFTNPIEAGPAPPLPPLPNHVGPVPINHGIPSYGMINNIPSQSNNGHNSNGSSGSKDVILGNKMHLNDRNSHSLQHDFSQLYISNLKSHMRASKNHSFTQAKRHDRYDGPVLPTLEELNSYKKEATEVKKQMMQMEKSITFYCDSTDYWRTKWRKTRDEKNQSRSEIKRLKLKLSRLEQQLQASEDKRTRLIDEVNILHTELSRYVYKFDTEGDGRQREKQFHPVVHYNSDRRVDYPKQRRKKETVSSKRNDLSSTEEEELQRFDHLRSAEISFSKAHAQRLKEPSNSAPPSASKTNPKVVLRNHDRLLDKKIVNRKRFSQVVMCDEDEIFQFNQDIPSNSLSKSSDNNTLKYSEQNVVCNSNNNESLNNDTNSYQQRLMEHVSEEEEEVDEECLPEEEEEDLSDQFRRCQQILADDSTNGFTLNKSTLNHSNLSTMATNSECANVGSIRTDDVDEDSFRSDKQEQVRNPKKVGNAMDTLEANRESEVGDDDDDDEV